MRMIATILTTAALCGCHTQTHITRTVRHPDGSVETYENRSDGYNYNPNFTGHWDNNYQIRANTNSNQQFSAEFAPQMGQFGQYNIK